VLKIEIGGVDARPHGAHQGLVQVMTAELIGSEQAMHRQIKRVLIHGPEHTQSTVNDVGRAARTAPSLRAIEAHGYRVFDAAMRSKNEIATSLRASQQAPVKWPFLLELD
jgi:hypothetical protein